MYIIYYKNRKTEQKYRTDIEMKSLVEITKKCIFLKLGHPSQLFWIMRKGG